MKKYIVSVLFAAFFAAFPIQVTAADVLNPLPEVGVRFEQHLVVAPVGKIEALLPQGEEKILSPDKGLRVVELDVDPKSGRVAYSLSSAEANMSVRFILDPLHGLVDLTIYKDVEFKAELFSAVRYGADLSKLVTVSYRDGTLIRFPEWKEFIQSKALKVNVLRIASL